MQSTHSSLLKPCHPVVVGALAIALVGCGKSVLAKPVAASAGAWKIEAVDFRDGPNEYATASTRYQPEDGTRFLWAMLYLTNATPQKRRFNWDRCDLDDGEDAYLPALVLERGLPRGNTDIVDPGQRLERAIVFSFPEEQWPSRLRCGDVVLPLKLRLEE